MLLLEATSPAIKAAGVEAVRQGEKDRLLEDEQQRAEELERGEKALVADVEKRLGLWLAAGRYRQLADAVEAMKAPSSEDDLPARWVAWLRSYATRVEEQVARKLPDPEKGPEPSWRY